MHPWIILHRDHALKGSQPATPLKLLKPITDSASRPSHKGSQPASPSAKATNHIPVETTDSASRPRPQKVHSRQHQSQKFRRKSLILYRDHAHKDSHRPQHDRQPLQPITYRRKSLILQKATRPRHQRFTVLEKEKKNAVIRDEKLCAWIHI